MGRVVVLVAELAWVNSTRAGACLPARGAVLVQAARGVGCRVEPHDGQTNRGPVRDPARRVVVPAAPTRNALPAKSKPERTALLPSANAVYELISRLGLPQHIAAYGLGEPELGRAAGELAGKHEPQEILAIYLSAF